MSRIVIDARRIRESTGRYARELLRELQKIDLENEYHVIIHQNDQTHWKPDAKNFYLHVVPYDAYTFGEQLGFAKFLRSLKPDLVHFTMPQQPLLYFGKRVTTVHDLTLVRFKNLDKNKLVYGFQQAVFKFLLKNVSRRSVAILTPSKFVKKDIIEYAKIDAEKVTVTYEAEAPIKDLKPVAIDKLRDKRFILYVGNAFPHKNLDRLVRAFEEIVAAQPDLHLALAGKKEFFYERLQKENQDVSNVHYLGFVSDEQLAWAFKHTEAYVFPSLSEGFGLPGLDAMQYGVPLISSNATCLPEIYGEAAQYFDPADTGDMANAISKVLGNRTLRSTLVKNGVEQLNKYSWQQMAKKTHQVYQKSLTKN